VSYFCIFCVRVLYKVIHKYRYWSKMKYLFFVYVSCLKSLNDENRVGLCVLFILWSYSLLRIEHFMTCKYGSQVLRCGVFFLQGRDTHMRQIKVHSPVQDRIGGTGHQTSFQFPNIFNQGLAVKNEPFEKLI